MVVGSELGRDMALPVLNWGQFEQGPACGWRGLQPSTVHVFRDCLALKQEPFVQICGHPPQVFSPPHPGHRLVGTFG